MDPVQAYPNPTPAWVEWALACRTLGARWATYVRLASLADNDGVVVANRAEILEVDYGISPGQLTNHLSWLRREEHLEGNVGAIRLLRQEQLGLRITPAVQRSSGPARVITTRGSTPTETTGTTPAAGALDSSRAGVQRAFFEAFEAELGKATTRQAQARYGRVAAELTDDGMDPAEVPARCAALRRKWKNRVTLTVEALHKHWHEADAAPQGFKPTFQTFGRPAS